MSVTDKSPRASTFRSAISLMNIAAIACLALLPVIATTMVEPTAMVVVCIGAGLFRGIAIVLKVQSEQAIALARIEDRLETIASSVERSTAAPAAIDAKLVRFTEARLAIRQGRWDDARRHLDEFQTFHPDDLDAPRLARELDDARDSAGKDLLAKVAAAREVNDPERVIELRDELRQLLPSEELRAIDRDLAKWFMTLIHRRLRTGTVKPDVAVLAAKVSASLDETPEGASLRASLPTLRRAAGLCPRCGQPYTGVGEACPACLTGTVGSPGFSAPAEESDPDEGLEPVELTDEFGMGHLGD